MYDYYPLSLCVSVFLSLHVRVYTLGGMHGVRLCQCVCGVRLNLCMLKMCVSGVCLCGCVRV